MERLRDALEGAGIVPKGQSWRPLAGGRTNRLWQVGSLVVKQYSRDENPLFANDPMAEWSALQLLSGTGLAPKPVASGAFEDDNYVVYQFCEGLVWQKGVEAPAKTLRQLHAISRVGDFPVAPDGSNALAVQTRTILGLVGGAVRDDLLSLEPSGIVAPSGKRALLHSDPVAANFVVGSSTILVDWQCPAIGDPVEDLAIFLSPAMQLAYRGAPLTQVETANFIAIYQDAEAAARLAALAPWHHWRMAAYCAWKEQYDSTYAEGKTLELAALKRVTERAL